jgi:hypothetical protein
MAEMLSPNNIQQLQEDLSAVDLCSQKSDHGWKYEFSLTAFFTEGMDDCDTAALTFQCGQEKAPGVLANAITSVELSSSEMVITLLLENMNLNRRVWRGGWAPVSHHVGLEFNTT